MTKKSPAFGDKTRNYLTLRNWTYDHGANLWSTKDRSYINRPWLEALHIQMFFDAEQLIDRMDGVCTWKQQDPWEYGDGTHTTSCNEMHAFTDGGVADNHYKFCPYCGKRIFAILHEFPKEEEDDVCVSECRDHSELCFGCDKVRPFKES